MFYIKTFNVYDVSEAAALTDYNYSKRLQCYWFCISPTQHIHELQPWFIALRFTSTDKHVYCRWEKTLVFLK